MSTSTVAIVRAVAPENIDSFHRALDSVSQERKYLTFLEAPPLEEFRQFVLSMLKEGNPQFVAVVDGEVVGWCDIRRHFFPSHAHRGSLGMGIVRSYRGRGLGLQLLNAAMTQARELGFVRIEFSVRSDNSRAIALYEKVGFLREGTSRDAVFVDGRYFDVINMAMIYR